MIRRNVATLALVVASLALAACADATGPTSTKAEDTCRGIITGSGICVPK